MMKYLKAAFSVRPAIAGLGRVPVNVLGVIVFLILGFGHPAFWLLGIGLETAFLAWLSTNPRFQKVIDGVDLTRASESAGDKRKALEAQLIPPAQNRLKELHRKCNRAVELAKQQGVEDYIIDGNQEALDKLSWLYLRLLLARQLLSSQESQTTEASLRTQAASLEKELSYDKLPPTLRESKSATLTIVQRRLENLGRREQSMTEIDADLTRIEAQVDLAVENAAMSGQPQAVSSNISLVSHLLDPQLFGDAQSAVADLDETYGRPTETPERA